MKVGDLVVSKYDIERHIHCVGVVTDINSNENFNVKIHWLADKLNPFATSGWWQEEGLLKIE
tara:strand:- start:710 stop:895 length:186 start_codon:yes stop_codon:yes gene_type:complete